MTGSVGFPVVCTARAPDWRKPVRRVEKSRSGNGLHDDVAPDDGQTRSSANESRQRPTSRFDTRRAPLRHATRFSAPFVAQILGQVMEGTQENAPSACAAYAHPCGLPRGGARVDRRA
jgi:hypothetical protein